MRFKNSHQALRLAIRQGLKEHALEQAKNRAAGADSQAQRDDGEHGEAGTDAKRPQPKAEILT